MGDDFLVWHLDGTCAVYNGKGEKVSEDPTRAHDVGTVIVLKPEKPQVDYVYEINRREEAAKEMGWRKSL